MGQKVNPISLRLPINRSVDSSWFSDAYNTKLMVQYIHLQKYIESLFHLAPNLTLGRFFVDVFPKKWILSCFIHEKRNFITRINRNQKKIRDASTQQWPDGPKAQGVRSVGPKGWASSKPSLGFEKAVNRNLHPLGLTNVNAASVFTFFYQQIYTQTTFSRIYQPQQLFMQNLISFIIHNKKIFSLCLNVLNQGKQTKNFRVSQSFLQNNLTRKWLYPKDLLLQQVESSINKNVNCSTQVFLMKSPNSLSSANFFVKEIATQLEKKISINQIWNQSVKKVIQTPSIQGIRLSVSGRINGVEMARTEIRKYGQTSLHSLSNKMDYASCYAYTPFGILGVKIWICYR